MTDEGVIIALGEDAREAADAGDATQGEESGKKYSGFSLFLPRPVISTV